MRQVSFAGCRLKFNYNWKTAGTKKKGKAIDLRDCYMTLFTIAQQDGFHINAKPAEAMGGEYTLIGKGVFQSKNARTRVDTNGHNF